MSEQTSTSRRFRLSWLVGEGMPLDENQQIPVGGKIVERIDKLVISFFDSCLSRFESLWFLLFVLFVAISGLLAGIFLPWSWDQAQPWQLIGVVATLVVTYVLCLGIFQTWYPAQLREHVRLGGKIKRLNDGTLCVVAPQHRR